LLRESSRRHRRRRDPRASASISLPASTFPKLTDHDATGGLLHSQMWHRVFDRIQ